MRPRFTRAWDLRARRRDLRTLLIEATASADDSARAIIAIY